MVSLRTNLSAVLRVAITRQIMIQMGVCGYGVMTRQGICHGNVPMWMPVSHCIGCGPVGPVRNGIDSP